MTVELLRDLEREHGWVLLVDGSEQSYVDVREPAHLEFEYVEHIAAVISVAIPAGPGLTALHLGGGLATIPRWLADRHPASAQLIVELSDEIASHCLSLGLPDGIVLRIGDAHDLVNSPPKSPARLCVIDLYTGPDTVTSLYSLAALGRVKQWLQPTGLAVANLSDATPFEFARSAAAAMRVMWQSVVVVSEPAVLRGRRSGNVVLAASDVEIDIELLTRRCAATMTRGRVMGAGDLTDWIGDAVPAATARAVPASGELDGIRF